MQDRGYIKWAPFNSLINDKDIFKEKEQIVKKVNKPILSEDQLSYINDKVITFNNTYVYFNQIISINNYIE